MFSMELASESSHLALKLLNAALIEGVPWPFDRNIV
jgi:hypothetical protein